MKDYKGLLEQPAEPKFKAGDGRCRVYFLYDGHCTLLLHRVPWLRFSSDRSLMEAGGWEFLLRGLKPHVSSMLFCQMLTHYIGYGTRGLR